MSACACHGPGPPFLCRYISLSSNLVADFFCARLFVCLYTCMRVLRLCYFGQGMSSRKKEKKKRGAEKYFMSCVWKQGKNPLNKAQEVKKAKQRNNNNEVSRMNERNERTNEKRTSNGVCTMIYFLPNSAHPKQQQKCVNDRQPNLLLDLISPMVEGDGGNMKGRGRVLFSESIIIQYVPVEYSQSAYQG